MHKVNNPFSKVVIQILFRVSTLADSIIGSAGRSYLTQGDLGTILSVLYLQLKQQMSRRILLLLAIVSLPMYADASDAGQVRATLEELRAKYAGDNGQIAVIEGIEVYYKDEGHGPAILMVHGSRSTLKTWDYVAAELKNRYRVIRYDIPPQGLSGPVSDAQAAALEPTDIPEALLALLDVERVTFVGVSSGATLGVYLAAKRPDLVERLVLSNMPADPVDTSHLQMPEAFIEEQRKAKESGFESLAFWNLFLNFFSGDPQRIDAGIREQYYDFNRRIPEDNNFSLVGTVANHEAATLAMSQVVAPTLLIWGGKDQLLVPETADTLAGYLSATQVSKILMPDVGHYPPLESPRRFAQLTAAFIEAAAPIH